MVKEIRANPGPQERFVSCPVEEVFFGGSRGPGKSFGVLLKWIVHASVYGADANGIILRRRYTDLRDLIRESTKLYTPLGGRFNKSNSQWTFPQGPLQGAVLTLAHAWDYADIQKYQGWNLSFCFFEELTNWPTADVYLLMLGSMRSSAGVPIKFGATGNPGGSGHCLSPETDVLTPQGWKNIAEFTVGDPVLTVDKNKQIVESTVAQFHAAAYDGPMIHVDMRGLTMRMTPNHSVPVITESGFKLAPFCELPSQIHLLRSAKWTGEELPSFTVPTVDQYRRVQQPGTISGIHFAKLMGWYLSEGNCCKDTRAFRITQTKGPYVEEIRDLLKEIGFTFREYTDKFHVQSTDWWHYLKQFGKSKEKYVPREIMQAGPVVLAAFLECAMKGDGNFIGHMGTGCYYTKSDRLRDDMMEIMVKLGYQVSMGAQKRIHCIFYKKGEGTYIRTGHRLMNWTGTVSNMHTKTQHYSGNVYCLGIKDTHTFIVRQNGTTWVSGNSWVKRRFIDPCPEGYKIITDQDSGMNRVFIPATIEDNPILMENDPTYERRLRALGNNTMVKAWRYGLWNVTSTGFFDDIWTPHAHILPHFKVPSTWRRARSFDWGDASPASLGQWSISDGTPVDIPGRGITKLPRGSIVRTRELYVCERDSGGVGMNKGLRWGNVRLGGEIGKFSAELHHHFSIADPSVFNRQGGESIYEQMVAAGSGSFRPASNDRIEGWQKMRDMLRESTLDHPESPGMWIMENCVDWIRTVPSLQMDLKNPDDVDTTLEDHCFVGGTRVSTEQGVFSLAQLVGTTGRVWSEDGRLHDYRSARLTRKNCPVIRLTFNDGLEITCTPDHKFLTSQGWTEAQNLLSQFLTPFKSSEESDITYAEDTSSAKELSCTEQSGKRITGLSQKATKSITRPTTLARIKSTIWSASQAALTHACTCLDDLKSQGKALKSRKLPRVSGTEAPKAESGTNANMRNTALRRSRPQKWSFAANTAGSPLCLSPEQGIALTTADTWHDIRPEWTTKLGSVSTVAPNLLSTSTARQDFVPRPAVRRCIGITNAGRADVYCLTVPDTGNFVLEGGVLVRNCADESRYMVNECNRTVVTKRTMGF